MCPAFPVATKSSMGRLCVPCGFHRVNRSPNGGGLPSESVTGCYWGVETWQQGGSQEPNPRDLHGGPVRHTLLPMQGDRFDPWLGNRSHMPQLKRHMPQLKRLTFRDPACLKED